ncbi:MAG: hypothetical protein IJ724_11315 [Muribaculaceae bacterium]|nr:hypothetical protein [Muribaculaceae bacterium]
MKRLQSIVIAAVLITAIAAQAQYQMLRNYPSVLTGGGTQNWNLMQTQEGLLYLANSRGLMCYDGCRWTCVPNANYSDVRAIWYDAQRRRVYAGGFNELGYYDLSNRLAAPRYVSLMAQWMAQGGDLGDVWSVHPLADAVVFQCKRHLVVFREGQKHLQVMPTQSEVMATAVDNGRLMVACADGLYALNGKVLTRLPGDWPASGVLVRAILSTDYGLLLVTAEQGVYRYDGEVVLPWDLDITPFLMQSKVFCAAASGACLAFGTIRNGLVVKNMKTGQCDYANVATGLQNNTILSVAFDMRGNVWMGLDNGVAYMMRDMAFQSLLGDNRLIGRGYASLVDGNLMYLATNQGLFTTAYPLNSGAVPPTVQPVAGITGQVWSLRKTDAGILCGCDQGTMLIREGTTSHIAGPAGTWDFCQLKHHPGVVLGCDYNGFFVMRITGGTVTYLGKVEGIELSSARFEEDSDGTIWIADWQKGIYHIWLNDDGTRVVKQEHFGKDHGLLVEGGNQVCKLQDTVMVSSVDGFLRYDRATGKLTHVQWLNQLVNHYGTSVAFCETPSHDAWVLTGDNIILLRRQATGAWEVDSATFESGINLVTISLGHMGFADSTHTIFNTNNGFCVANQSLNHAVKVPLQVMIRRVTDLNGADTMYTVEQQGDKTVLEIPKRHNSVRIEFALPEFHGEGMVTYQCWLQGYDREWGAEQREPSKDYTQLPKGTYRLHVRARNHYDATISEATITLVVLPAWYETWWAYGVYAVLLVLACWLAMRMVGRRQQRALERIEQERRRQLKEQEMAFEIEKARQEHEVMEAHNAQLTIDLKHKTSELGDFTMNLMRKNDMLQQLDTTLAELADGIKADETKAKLAVRVRAIRKSITDNMNDDDNWDKFEENFNLVYDNFMAKLLDRFPDLNKNDRKLCAYLRLGLSSKEIASLLNISVRSVETFRYRLRKKLGLEQGESMTEFFDNL